jgi:hypothetical protein
MRWIGAMTLLSMLACASTSSTSSPASSSGDQRSDSQSCSSPLVSAVVERDTDVFASPDSTSAVIAVVHNRAKVCADSSATGYGFRRVRLADGRSGFVDNEFVSELR